MIKEKILHNWQLKLVILIFATVFWRVIGEVADPVITTIYRSIPVTILNEELVTDTGMVYQVEGEAVTTVVITASTSTLRGITEADIVATADFANIMFEELLPIEVSVSGVSTSSIQDISITPSNIIVSIEQSDSKKFPIVPASIGSVADSYDLGSLTAQTETITISGPESIVESIVRVEAEVNISNLTENEVLTAQLICYDDDNIEIDQSLLTLNIGDVEDVYVNVEVLNTAYIPIVLETFGEPASGYELVSVTAEPTEILVSGTKEVLDEIVVISIPGGALDITGETGKLDRVVDVSLYLPEEIQLYDEYSNMIAVTIQIDELGTKSLEIPVQSIVVNNNPSDLNLSYNGATEIMLTFTGLEEELEGLELTNITVSVDLSEYTEAGEYDALIYVDSEEEYELIDTVTVPIILTEK